MMPTGQADKKKLQRAKLIYYLDEISILFIIMIAVIFSDAISQRAKGVDATTGDLKLDFMNLIISGMFALITYGTLHTKFTYNDKKKPPYIKRLTNALLQGIAWRSVIGWVN